jgi:hypothetical protein
MTQVAEYCRELETYLCKKNEGHLIRIVGPVFEQVSGWAAQGVPLAIAFRGIDRYCERYYSKGPRRRPVRIEFCEADILELFDDWRRAVGVSSLGQTEEPSERKRDSLPAHIDRAIARLTALRGGGRSASLAGRIDDMVRELDTMRTTAKSLRGDARTTLIARLSALDRALLDLARSELDEGGKSRLRTEADAEIAPFAVRMTRDARDAAVQAAFDRLVREQFALPVLTFMS